MTPRRPLGHSLRQAAKALLLVGGCYLLVQRVAYPHACGHLFSGRSKRERALWDLGSLTHALKTHAQRTGQLPPAEAWPTLVDAGLLETEPVDPWGRPYVFSVAEDGGATVSSLGADGQVGGTGADEDLVHPFTVKPAPPSTRQ